LANLTAGWPLVLLALSVFSPPAGTTAVASTSDDTSRIAAFSARAVAGSDAQTLVLGFAVSGDGNSFLVRGVGPTLSSFGVTHALADPQLTLFSGSQSIASNDNWGSDASAPGTGAYPLPVGSFDAAVLKPLDHGLYTAHITGKNGSGGVALAEIYETHSSSPGRLSAVSARSRTGNGEESLITGFVIAGRTNKTVLVRAVGPALASHGVSGSLANPKLELFLPGSGSAFASNDDWTGSELVSTAITQLGALPFAAGSKDSALLVTLAPGTYTARVSGSGGSATGVALFELFDNPVAVFPRTSANNVVYRHGDVIKFAASGSYQHADGSRTDLTDGWLRLEILDEGVTNPLNNNLPVMSLVETQLYVGAYVMPDGSSVPVRIVGFPTTRYYVQDQYGTIVYQGEKVPEGVTSTGAPNNNTYWFSSPLDYIQYQAPFVIGATKTTPYTKQAAASSTQKLGNTFTTVEATETITVPLGTFDTYRVRLLETSREPANYGATLWSRTQNIHPDIGIVRFDFFSATPGDTGAFVMALSETNLPYFGGNTYPLAQGNRLKPIAAGQVTRFVRSGYYIGDNGTIEEISGWFTMEVLDEGVVNPITNRRVFTLLETHYTAIEATDLAGTVTHSTQQQAFKRYCEVNINGESTFVGDTGPNGNPVWFDHAFIPLSFPYSIGQTKTESVNASYWVDGHAVPAFSYTPSMRVISLADVRTPLGTFECYRMTYEDSTGYRAEQYTYPAVGVTQFTYPAPAGKSGHMNLTLSSTNVSFQ
jgi:hypothetical protein